MHLPTINLPVKFRYSETAKKIWPIFHLQLDTTISNVKKEWEMGQIFMAFSEYLKFNFEGLDVSKKALKAFSFLQPLLHEWMSEWMKSWLEVVMIKEVKKGKPNNHQFTLITYTNIRLTTEHSWCIAGKKLQMCECLMNLYCEAKKSHNLCENAKTMYFPFGSVPVK